MTARNAAEQEAAQVGVVDLPGLPGVSNGLIMEIGAVEPLHEVDVALQDIEDAAFLASTLAEVVELGPQDAGGQVAPHVLEMRTRADGVPVGDDHLRQAEATGINLDDHHEGITAQLFRQASASPAHDGQERANPDPAAGSLPRWHCSGLGCPDGCDEHEPRDP